MRNLVASKPRSTGGAHRRPFERPLVRVGALATALFVLGALALVPVVLPDAADASTTVSKSTSQVTKTKTVTRSNLENGTSTTVESRNVSVTVSQTKDLHGRQEIGVSWKGAHPTGNTFDDLNSIQASEEEYPFVLLECRGVDSTSVAASKRISQQTCWTQSWIERYQGQYDYGVWRTDRYAPAADRAAIVNQPSPLPSGCNSGATSKYYLPFVAANGTKYYGGTNSCAGSAPESTDAGGALSLPSNETFGITQKNGVGNARFDVFTSAENASLGCSATVACSLVAVPVMGLSCDASGSLIPAASRPLPGQLDDARTQCESKGNFAAGTGGGVGGEAEALSVSGALWWSASNWRNRISIPLSFAPAADVCDITGSGSGSVVDVYGSELLAQATTQWSPKFCLDKKLFKIKHVYTGEPAARNLLQTGSADAAFVSYAPADGYSEPVVNAPVAATGFAITYAIDDANKHEYTKLKLNARLLAKLLTESYPANSPVKKEYAALHDNPQNITLDPEFIKLNPGIVHGVGASEAASALLTLSDQSDVTRALTSYINADPDARAWLNGVADPWGMKVNPNYLKISLPVDSWPLLDTFVPTTWYKGNENGNPCLFDNPVPYLPLVAAPLATLSDISQSMQFAIANPQTTCQQLATGQKEGEKLVASGRQSTGYRFMIGVSSIADAQRYRLDTASLETSADHYVAPTDTSLRQALKLLQGNPKTGTWTLPYATLKKAAGQGAYPGTLLVYLAVPTQGLAKSEAKDYATFLRYVVGAGQKEGEGNGDLPDGYLPLTAANGAAGLVSYSQRAATAIEAQNGTVPPLVASPASDSPAASEPGTGTTDGSAGGGGTGTNAAGTGTGGSTVVPTPTASVVPGVTGGGPSEIVAAGLTRAAGGGLGGLALPALLLIALLAGVLAPVFYFARRRAMR